jgi:hypothetical protein
MADDAPTRRRRADASSPSARRAGRVAARSRPDAVIGEGRLTVAPLVPGIASVRPRALVIACGALLQELQAVARLNGWTHLDVTGIPASYHNRPERIPDAVRAKIRAAREAYGDILVAFGDCGTGGRLDEVLVEEGVRRIEGAHCYAFFSGIARFEDLHEEEIGSFYLTDFLALHFETLVLDGLKLDRHPGLLEQYFGNYRRVVHLAQMPNPAAAAAARQAAERLHLPLVTVETGLGELAAFLVPGDQGE